MNSKFFNSDVAKHVELALYQPSIETKALPKILIEDQHKLLSRLEDQSNQIKTNLLIMTVKNTTEIKMKNREQIKELNKNTRFTEEDYKNSSEDYKAQEQAFTLSSLSL